MVGIKRSGSGLPPSSPIGSSGSDRSASPDGPEVGGADDGPAPKRSRLHSPQPASPEDHAAGPSAPLPSHVPPHLGEVLARFPDPSAAVPGAMPDMGAASDGDEAAALDGAADVAPHPAAEAAAVAADVPITREFLGEGRAALEHVIRETGDILNDIERAWMAGSLNVSPDTTSDMELLALYARAHVPPPGERPLEVYANVVGNRILQFEDLCVTLSPVLLGNAEVRDSYQTLRTAFQAYCQRPVAPETMTGEAIYQLAQSSGDLRERRLAFQGTAAAAQNGPLQVRDSDDSSGDASAASGGPAGVGPQEPAASPDSPATSEATTVVLDDAADSVDSGSATAGSTDGSSYSASSADESSDSAHTTYTVTDSSTGSSTSATTSSDDDSSEAVLDALEELWNDLSSAVANATLQGLYPPGDEPDLPPAP